MCQSLSTASSAPPILQQGFHVLAACVPLAHILSELKGYAPPSTHCLRQTDANAVGIKDLITVLVFRVEVAKYLYLHSRLLELMAYGCPPPPIQFRVGAIPLMP